MQPPSLSMRVNGQMNNTKTAVEMNQLQKPGMFQQNTGINPDMQPDNVRMFDGRPVDKNPQYQVTIAVYC